ncbi:hypothetical protein [Acidobacterium sp. S8]|uniref:hypothetical protein n=1 Tax=Acidobacterium sp. S8 TaxID=1641854 RepID=UPI00131C5774|nr:hypothetical protein [Acidobacterium sp. S8]
MLLPHRYFAAWPTSDRPVIELAGGSQWNPSLPAEWRYPLAVLSLAEPSIQDRALHFYITKDAVRLPEYGPHVVAVLLQEERCKVPSYALHVRGIVRNLHFIPFLGFRPRWTINRLNAVLTFEYARDWMLHYRSRQALHTPHPEWPPRLHSILRICTIPLGYHSQEELPQIAMQDRTLDSFFAGELVSEVPPTTYRYWVSTSKAEARKQLWRALQEIKRDPEWQIDLDNIGTADASSRAAQFNSYSKKMMNSRICLAPRGSMAETYRLYEGLRAGCLVITNRLPDEPFLRNSPVIQVDHWKELPGLLRRYARDFVALEHYRQAGLEWWQKHCHEDVIGPQVGHFLNGCPGGCP